MFRTALVLLLPVLVACPPTDDNQVTTLPTLPASQGPNIIVNPNAPAVNPNATGGVPAPGNSNAK